MTQQCEACEFRMAEIVEPCDDPQEPYHLCSDCHRRLQFLALRPLEWYNLSKRHGFQFLLHDDFYDDDGTAAQPKDAVIDPELFPAPTLSDVSHDLKSLLDYSITRWRFEPELANAWRKLPQSDVLGLISNRYARTTNTGIRSRILEIAATLGEFAGDLVRCAWRDDSERMGFFSLANASASCLPYREGFDRVASSLAKLEKKEMLLYMYSLSYFHSPEPLDWIERNIFEPVSDSWGRLAAASQMDWLRVERWLISGRPLSLAAIDALVEIKHSIALPAHQNHRLALLDPPSKNRFCEVLLAYAKRDPVPRVQKRIEGVIAHADALIAGSE